jgi:CPA2 family monovalent cation:H+ antiporter-2
MLIDPALFLEKWHWIVPGALFLIIFKSLITTVLLRLVGERADTAVRTGLVLSQGGEFGFVLVTLAVSLNVFSPDRAGLIVAMTVLTMIATPALIQNSARVARKVQQRMSLPDESNSIADDISGHVILCGYGRVGQNLSRYLSRFHIETVAIDSDIVRIHESSQAGEKILFGDASRKDTLERAGIHRASLLVITFDDARRAEKIMRLVHSFEPNMRVLVRTRDDTSLDQLIEAGATEVVPEVLEASLMLIAHALLLMEVPLGKVLATLRQSRRDRYKLLHGYYHGDSFPSMDSAGNAYRLLHAVTLAGKARCQGRRISETGLEKLNVTIRAIRRAGTNIQDPEGDTVLESGDVVILYGPLDAVERGEELLLGG